jgi:SAM-dependent methyltransferase
MHDQYEAQFLDWVHPLDAACFSDEVVLDAGCGIGRHSFFAAEYGARDVVAMDLSNAVETARDVLVGHDNAHVVQGDILKPPLRAGVFDLAYSIGVLHHLPDPEAGFASMARVVKDGGTAFAWVYGYENNGVVRHVIDPLRRHITTKLRPSLMRVIGLPLAIAFHGVVKGVYRPLRRTKALRLLPLGAYIASLSSFSFRQNYNIVFDQLVAPTAHYLRRDEFEAWFRRAGLTDIEISSRNGNSWRGRGRRP